MKKSSRHFISLRSLTLATITSLLTLSTVMAEAQVRGSIGRGGGYDGGYQEDRGGRGPGRGEPGRGGHRPDRGGHRGDLNDWREVDRLVTVLYEGALFRSPDRAGLDGFSRHIRENGLIGLYNSARLIGSTEEFRQLVRYEGAERVVYNIYRVFFNRLPDYSGLQNWTMLLERGQGGDALDGIVRSEEFYRTQLR